MLTRFSARTLRVWVAVSVVLCTSCAHLPVARHGSESTPGRSVGRPGCGPPISYQVFQKDAYGADWSKADDLLAYNAKGSEVLPNTAARHPSEVVLLRLPPARRHPTST